MPPDTNAQVDPLQQIVQRLEDANNVLVTVSSDPSVDQLAACIGLTLALNKMEKHGTAVFSGKVPSTLEFLKPEQTIETTTNSLRDFIISLDKSKADKLRYKVEDDFVKIFITPYRASIDDSDLTYSQGDFNIDLVITLGVHEKEHLDAAIVAHGRILHDAPVISITTDVASELGTINWVDNEASSLCEMACDLVSAVNPELYDEQISTALLTGLVAETDRFGNEKARPHTMAVSGTLMAAGASTQLVASKLNEPEPLPQVEEDEADEPSDEIPALIEAHATEDDAEGEVEQGDGTIEIDHTAEQNNEDYAEETNVADEQEQPSDEPAENEFENHDAPEQQEDTNQMAQEQEDNVAANQPEEDQVQGRHMLQDPEQSEPQLTANTVPEQDQYSPSTDPLSVAAIPEHLLERTETQVDEPAVVPEDTSNQTLTELERSVASPHVLGEPEEDAPEEQQPPQVEEARAAVDEVYASNDTFQPEPQNALATTPLDFNLGQNPTAQFEENEAPTESEEKKDDGNSPPPVPPPMMPPAA